MDDSSEMCIHRNNWRKTQFSLGICVLNCTQTHGFAFTRTCACTSFNYLVVKRFWKIHWMPGSWNCIEGKFRINCGFDRIRNECRILWNFISQRKTSHRIFLVSATSFSELVFLSISSHAKQLSLAEAKVFFN